MEDPMIDLLSRFAALGKYLPPGTESWQIVEMPVAAANIMAARKLVEKLRPGYLATLDPDAEP